MRAARLTTAVAILCSAHSHAQVLRSATGTAAYPTPVFQDASRVDRLKGACAAVATLMADQMRDMHAPGLAWGVVIDGELACSGALGVREIGSQAPAGPDTVFRIASMTKSFTALAILALRDEGRLSLDDPVSKYIPEFAGTVLPTHDSPAITIRHLLTHSEGFPEDNPWGDRQLAVPDSALTDLLGAGVPFSTPPATAYEYSNLGFATLGHIVSVASGMSYRAFVTSHILTPLGMSSSYWAPSDVPEDRLAVGYRFVDGSWQREPMLEHGAYGAMGGLMTTIPDLGRYIAFMLSAWPPRDDAERGPVRRSSVREMQQGQRLVGLSVEPAKADAPLRASTRSYAYGLNASQDCQFRHIVAHGGGLPGFGSYELWLPDYGVGVFAFANVTYAPASRAVRAIVDQLAKTSALQPRVVPASAPLLEARERVTALVNTWSDAEANALAADNLFLDQSLDSRRQEVTALSKQLGVCRPEGDIDAENWLRGSFALKCDRGMVDVSLTLAPTHPPKVQFLSFTARTGDRLPGESEICAPK
jgi:CubicO group peptidase (beta-lactamase class C family)